MQENGTDLLSHINMIMEKAVVKQECADFIRAASDYVKKL